MTTFDHLPCTCTTPPEERRGELAGSYTVGCPRHTAQAAAAPATAYRPHAQVQTITYYRGRAITSKPVLKDGEVWSEQGEITCPHRHTDPDAAEACAEKLARKFNREAEREIGNV